MVLRLICSKILLNKTLCICANPHGNVSMCPLLTLISADQFIACGKSRERAHELASLIWLAVINNLEENERTFHLLKRLALEGNVRI